MKRVRVLKEMPFSKVGEEVDISHVTDEYRKTQVDRLFRDGWLEWVEEEQPLKSLEWKFKKSICVHPSEFAQIATGHFREKFDEAENDYSKPYSGRTTTGRTDHIRKAMFGGEK